MGHIIRIESNELKGSCNESIEFKKNIYSELEECHKYFLNVVNQLRNVLKMQNKNELKNYDSASLASSICSENSSKSLEWDTFVTEQESLSLEENEAMYISEEDVANSSKRSSLMSLSQLHSNSENAFSSLKKHLDNKIEKNKINQTILHKWLLNIDEKKLSKKKVVLNKFSKKKKKKKKKKS